jgi:hypothetical protein
MDLPREARGEIAPRLTPAILFFCAAAGIAWAFLIGGDMMFRWPLPYSERWLAIAAAASPLLFLSACVLVFLRPRFGYVLGLVGAGCVLAWVLRTEFLFGPYNSWLYLNYESAVEPEAGEAVRAVAVRRLLSAALVATASACALLRLAFPRRRTWPAFAAGFLAMAVWFVHSVTPYAEPRVCIRGLGAELRLLHVRKRGLSVHETAMIVQNDGKTWVLRGDRRLFQYRFAVRVGQTSLGASPAARELAWALVGSPELQRLQTPPPSVLRSWNADGWYVVLKDKRVLAFTSEQRMEPPREVVELFRQLEALPERAQAPMPRRDVCLGFCYDPVAALGLFARR